MRDEGSKDGHRASGGVLRPVGTNFVEFYGLCVRAVMSVCERRRMRFYVHKTYGQHRDVWAQRHDIPKGSVANVVALRPTS